MASAAASQPVVFGCPLTGQVEPVSHCPDPTFAREILGPGVCIQPEDCVLYAPADAQVEFLLSTKHALGLSTPQRIKFLIHLGLDTNRLEGGGVGSLRANRGFCPPGRQAPGLQSRRHGKSSLLYEHPLCVLQHPGRLEGGAPSHGACVRRGRSGTAGPPGAFQPVKAAPRVFPRESLVLPVGNKPLEGSCIFTGMPGFCRNRGLHTA